ncbi:hypothetical protein [Evansella halocellulosilytica]|nr:hypothetical protein [Evansella halocellulosilytica]
MAIGVLLELEFADSIDEAESMVKKIRPQVTIHPEFKEDLKALFPNSE